MSTLSNLSHLFQKFIYSQINSYMSNEFSKYQKKKFCKSRNTEYTSLNMTEKWKSNPNKGNKIGTFFADFSNPFATLQFEPLPINS